ncbi:MAG: amidohydrolase [Burkholderiales bacterium]|nr:amidohydrolase [Burkholderiales bacterium]
MTATLKYRCGIDAHAHMVPHDFPSYLGASVPADWPSMAPAQACHRSVMIAGKNYRTVSDRCWDTAGRIADMPEMGLDLQAISPMPELLSYWMAASDAQPLLRYLNEQIAAMVAESGGHLLGLGAVPLQDVDMAIRELEYCVRTLGFSGVEVGSNINGRPIGAPEFDPFLEACESLGAAVFVHAIRPAGMERLIGPPPLQQVLGYPSDVGLAAASVLTTNLMQRRPGLRIAFSHGGGTLGLLLPRLQQSWGVFPALKECITAAPREQARKLFFDTLVFDASTLRHLVAQFGETQLLIGTDYPFNFHDRRPVESIDAAGFDEATRELLLQGNARRFLGLPLEENT